jgi:hypothetical protein
MQALYSVHAFKNHLLSLTQFPKSKAHVGIKVAEQSMHWTLGMPSANALWLGDARWRLARPICAHPKQFPTPEHFSSWTALPSPPQRG